MTYNLVTFIPFKVISLSSNAPFPLPFPLLEALFEGCLWNHSHFICCIRNDVLYRVTSFSFRTTFNLENRKKVWRQEVRQIWGVVE